MAEQQDPAGEAPAESTNSDSTTAAEAEGSVSTAASPRAARDRGTISRQATAQARAQRAEFEKQYETQGGRGGFSRQTLAAEMLRLPSDPPLYEVMIDQFGAGMNGQPSHVRGDVLGEDDSPYDLEDAADRGVTRRLTMAEARSALASTTQPLTADGLAIDEDLAQAGPVMAGFHDWARQGVAVDAYNRPVTVTSAQGPKEPAELAKPTLPGPEDGAPAARPVLIAKEGQAHIEVARDFAQKQAQEARSKNRPRDRR